MAKIIVKYYSLKMLLTVDLNKLIQVLLETYGDNINIKFELMNVSEQKESSKLDDEELGIIVVKDRFRIFECLETGELKGCQVLEDRIIKEGIK